MKLRGFGSRNLLGEMRWLWLISLGCLSGRCVGQGMGSYDGFDYDAGGFSITIMGYTGPGGAVTIPCSLPLPGDPGVNLPVMFIGTGAFENCVSVTSVTIPACISEIGAFAFYGCGELTNVTIPSSVNSIGESAFSRCGSLTAITVDPQNGSYSSPGGVLCNKSQTTLLQCPGGMAGACAVANSVTAIGDSAFYACNGLTNITFGSGVTNIAADAFEGCGGLTAFTVDAQNPAYSSLGGALCNQNQTALVRLPPGRSGGYLIWPPGQGGSYAIPSGVTRIGAYAFSGCSGLSSVTIPNSVTTIGDSAFWWCSGLTNVLFPSNVTSIGSATFEGCPGLTSITIPSNVTNIGNFAFDGCNHLTSAYFEGDAPSVFGSAVFDGTAASFSIYYPYGASGWSTPTWKGYPAYPYHYPPPPPPPLALVLRSGVVTPSFNYLLLGTDYQLQVSTDLSTWSDAGPVFTATNTSELYPQPFSVTNWNRLFFRLQPAP